MNKSKLYFYLYFFCYHWVQENGKFICHCSLLFHQETKLFSESRFLIKTLTCLNFVYSLPVQCSMFIRFRHFRPRTTGQPSILRSRVHTLIHNSTFISLLFPPAPYHYPHRRHTSPPASTLGHAMLERVGLRRSPDRLCRCLIVSTDVPTEARSSLWMSSFCRRLIIYADVW